MVDTSVTQAMEQGLSETIQKVEASVLTAIDEHCCRSTDFSPQQGLDFLDTKNSLLLSYLIDLTVHLRNRLTSNHDNHDDDDDSSNNNNNNNMHRLLEMRTVLDKMHNLDKRLRYQIDKLLSYQSTASSFATGADPLNNSIKSNAAINEEDPLQFRPSVEALEEDDDDDDDDERDNDSSSSSNEDNHSGADNDDDDDLATARQTLRMAKAQQQRDNNDKPNEAEAASTTAAAIYQAPRLTAVPYTHDQEDRQAEREKRQRRRMRASELATALRQEFGDTPEQQDIHGGSALGQQRAAARRLTERQAEKTKFEEEQMVRLTVTRKEKKEQRRLMREENSNLAAIADLGNLVRDAAFIDKDEKRRKKRGDDEYGDNVEMLMSGRHANGKRKRQMIDNDGRAMSSRSGGKKRPIMPKNALQAALYSSSGGGGKSKKKKNKKSF